MPEAVRRIPAWNNPALTKLVLTGDGEVELRTFTSAAALNKQLADLARVDEIGARLILYVFEGST